MARAWKGAIFHLYPLKIMVPSTNNWLAVRLAGGLFGGMALVHSGVTIPPQLLSPKKRSRNFALWRKTLSRDAGTRSRDLCRPALREVRCWCCEGANLIIAQPSLRQSGLVTKNKEEKKARTLSRKSRGNLVGKSPGTGQGCAPSDVRSAGWITCSSH